MTPLPFGLRPWDRSSLRPAAFLDGNTIALVIGDAPYLLRQGVLTKLDAGAPVTRVLTAPPAELWLETSFGFSRWLNGTTRLIPAPGGDLARGGGGAIWQASAQTVASFDEVVGFRPATLPQQFDCPGVRAVAPFSSDSAAVLCDGPGGANIWSVGHAQSPLLLLTPDAGMQPGLRFELHPGAADEVVAVWFGSTGGPASLRLFPDGGSAPLPQAPTSTFALGTSSDGQLFAETSSGLYRLTAGAWSFLASATQVPSPIDLFGTTALFSNGLESGTATLASRELFTNRVGDGPCTGLSRGPHVMFVCGTRRFDASGGWLSPLPGTVNGTPFALDGSGELWLRQSGTVVKMARDGSVRTFGFTSTPIGVTGVVSATGDAWLFAGPGPSYSVFFKPLAGMTFNQIATVQEQAGVSWTDVEAFGDGALAAVGRRVLAFLPDGGSRDVFDAGSATMRSLCVVSPEEYYLSTSFPFHVFAGSDAGLRLLGSAFSVEACAPGRALSVGSSGQTIEVVRGPAVPQPMFPTSRLWMRDDGAIWAGDSSGQIVFRP